MRILHISDLHFGALSKVALESMERFIQTQQNQLDVVVVTGDWTQRGRGHQFQEAYEFLKSIHKPVVTVPGNHDIPLYHWVKRVFRPFRHYRHYIEPYTLRSFVGGKVAIWGMNTVAPFKIKEGHVRSSEIDKAQRFFDSQPEGTFKIIACHHPLIHAHNKKWISGMEGMQRLNPHIVLSGHSHLMSAEYKTYKKEHPILSIVSGTSTSGRLRGGETNSFHVLDVHDDHKVDIESYILSDSGFVRKEKPEQEVRL